MAKTPFFKVIVRKNGRDITDLISKFSHEDCVDQDNMMTLNINGINTDLIDDQDIREGSILTFQYGFRAGKTSPIYLARVTDIIPNYGDIINLTIRATDLGILLKKNKSKKIWQNLKASEIVTQIAQANGLRPVVEETDTVYKNMPQGSKSDYDFIKKLASIEKDGSWRFYLRNDEIHFTRLKLEKESLRTLTWNNGNGIVKSFKPYSQETLKDAASRDTVITSVDPFTNKPVQSVINNTTAKDDVKLGEFVYDFNSSLQNFRPGESIRLQGEESRFNLNNKVVRPSQVQKNQEDPNRTGSHVYSPAGNSTETDNIGNKMKKKKALGDYMATLSAEGDPDYIADRIVSMAGVAKKDLGNWYVSRANHTIDRESGYMIRLTMNKNAGKKAIGDGTKQSNVNNTKGPDQNEGAQAKKEVGVYTYDQNSVLLSTPEGPVK